MSLANRLAIASPKVRATTIEAHEFPELANRYQVHGVPHVLVDWKAAFAGALPEDYFVPRVLRLAGIEVEEPEPPA